MKEKTHDLKFDFHFTVSTFNCGSTVQGQCLEYLGYITLLAAQKAKVFRKSGSQGQ